MTTRGGWLYPDLVGHRRTASHAAVLLALALGAACTRSAEPAAGPPPEPRLPAGEAGELLRRAMDAAGGWARWAAHRDVSFISTLTIIDPAREITSDSIGWFAAPLHRGAVARMDSIGLPTEVRFGIDADDTWILSEGRPVIAPAQLALTRFDLVSSLFWFSLPFALAELPAELRALGEAPGEGGRRWLRLRADFDTPHPAVPGPWIVLYLDAETGLIDRVFARLSAPFLRHELWVGTWRRYRDCAGIRKERQRQFFPADDEGTIIGAMIAEQYVEHVRFDNGFDPQHFLRPPQVDGEEPVQLENHRAPGVWRQARLKGRAVEGGRTGIARRRGEPPAIPSPVRERVGVKGDQTIGRRRGAA